MRIIKLTEKSIDKMYGIAEMMLEAAETFMECLDEMEMGHREEDWDEEEYNDEDSFDDMESGNRSSSGYRSRSMGNRGGNSSGQRRGSMGHRGEIANRRGVKGTGRYSRY